MVIPDAESFGDLVVRRKQEQIAHFMPTRYLPVRP